MHDEPIHIHVNTTNLSAVKLHILLRNLGVKNNRFFLALYDKDLMYINPFDPNISKENMAKVLRECYRNLWYYIREIVRINVPNGVIPFEFHRGNLAMLWALSNNISSIVELPRQCTKTGTAAAFMSWAYNFGTQHSLISFLSKDKESVEANLKDVKQYIENLPEYLKIEDKEDRENTIYMYNRTTDNKIITRNPPNNPTTADKKGRGSREPMQWLDEGDFIPFVDIIMKASGPAYGESARKAELNNAPYFRLITTTPGYLDDPSSNFIYNEVICKSVRFDEKFYDLPIDKVKEILKKESEIEFLYIKYHYYQLGKSEEYLKNVRKTILNDQDKFEREILLKRSMRQSDSPFSKDQLDRIYKHCKPAVKSLIIQNYYVLKFFTLPDFKKKYVISVDCSGMLGGNNDYTSLCVIDPENFHIVATMRTNDRTQYSNTTRITYAIIDIMEKIFPNSLLVIEKNSMGIAIIDNILTLTNLGYRIYSSAKEPATNFKPKKPTDAKNYVYGFNTTEVRRDQMFSEIIGIVVNELYDGIYDETIYYEINNIIRNNKGKLQHKLGKHDDMLMSYLIGLWVLIYSRILQSYGFDPTTIRSMSVLDEEEKETHNTKTLDIEKRLDSIVDQQKFIELTKNNNIVYKEIAMLQKKLNEQFEDNKKFIYVDNPYNMSGNEICDMIYGSESDNISIDLQDGEQEIETENIDNKIYMKNIELKKKIEKRKRPTNVFDDIIFQ